MEREVEQIWKTLGGRDKSNWIEKITGSFANDPEFEEIVRLGREIRNADRPE